MVDRQIKLNEQANCDLEVETDCERRIILPIYIEDVNENTTYRLNGCKLQCVS